MSEQTPEQPTPPEPSTPSGTPASEVSARAQALAEQHGVDVSNVEGTGDKGRVTYADVEQHVQ